MKRFLLSALTSRTYPFPVVAPAAGFAFYGDPLLNGMHTPDTWWTRVRGIKPDIANGYACRHQGQCMFVVIGSHLVNISIPGSGATGWFRPLRRPTFDRAQKWAKRPVPTSGPTLRFGFLPYAIAPVWTRRRAIHGPSALARHPCLAPHYAMTPLSLLKGRPAASDIPCTEKQRLAASLGS